MGRLVCVLVLAALAATARWAAAEVREIGPDTPWCAAANSLMPGDELALLPGDYPGSCTIRNGGAPGAPVVIRASDPTARPRLVYLDSTDNVVNIAASFVTLRGLALGPTLPNVDGVRVRSGGDEVTVEDSTFTDLGGIAVVSHSTGRRLTIRGNEIRGSKSTAIYIGCHDGVSCRIMDAVVEGNYLHGVDAPAPLIGYGIQVKLNSTAIIRDNVIVDTKGPGIMVYGAHDPAHLSIVERNFVARSRTSSGIVLGGGPALVRNNVAFGAARAGITLLDYGGRSLLRGIVVGHNTLYGGRTAGIEVPADARVEAHILYNAAHTASGPAVPPTSAGVVSVGNVNCSGLPCFMDPLGFDFGPLPGSPLAGRVLEGKDAPQDDFFGAPRSAASAVGAVESSRGGIRLGRKLGPR